MISIKSVKLYCPKLHHCLDIAFLSDSNMELLKPKYENECKTQISIIMALFRHDFVDLACYL